MHAAFETEVKALGRADLSTEVSYLNGRRVARGTPGSVRLDVVEGDPTAPRAVYDFEDWIGGPDHVSHIPNTVSSSIRISEHSGDPHIPMTNADWRKFATSRLLQDFPRAVVVRDMLVLPGVKWLLSAVAMESSDFSATKFSMTAFVLPLYVPTTHVYFLFGGRLGSLSGGVECWWDTAEASWEDRATQAVRDDARPLFDTLKGPIDLIAYSRHRLSEPRKRDPGILEIEGYSYVLGDDGPSGQRTLLECLDMIDRFTTRPAWFADMAARVRQVNDALAIDLSIAKGILRSWSETTVTALKLDQIRKVV